MGLSVLISIGSASSLFCSEFVAHVLYQSNLKFWNTSYMVRPYDFGTDDRFEVIYEGRL